jgi:hypothetical protein
MRPIFAAAALAALAFSAAAEAVAASGAPRIHSGRTSTLGCEIMRAGFIDVRNNTRQTIAKGTRIELVIVAVAGHRTFGVKKTVTTQQELGPGLYHAFAPVPRGAKSCSARVRLLPDYRRRSSLAR